MLKHIRLFIALDTNVQRVLAYRVWTIVAGLISLFFIPLYLGPEEQGYFFTFLSIVAIQALFDLGLSQTVAQISSHEFAHLNLSEPIAGVGNPHIAKLAYVKSVIDAWYRKVAALFVIVVIALGIVYFSNFGTGQSGLWFGPWMVLVTATGANLIIAPRLAFVEGAGQTGKVASVRLFQSVLGYALLVVTLINGGQLWSVAVVPVTSAVISFCWLYWIDNPYRFLPSTRHSSHNVAPWRSELLGLQWRVALSWLGGYFAIQSIVPITFAINGAADAGKIGLGLQIFSAVQTLGMSWVSAQVPLYGQLISRSEWALLKVYFVRAMLNAAIITSIIGVCAVVALEILQHADPLFSTRLPSLAALCALAAIATSGTVIYSLAAYMRAHKEEPLVFSSLMIGLITLIFAAVGAHINSTTTIILYAFVNIFINFPWTYLIYRKYRDRNQILESDIGKQDLA